MNKKKNEANINWTIFFYMRQQSTKCQWRIEKPLKFTGRFGWVWFGFVSFLLYLVSFLLCLVSFRFVSFLFRFLFYNHQYGTLSCEMLEDWKTFKIYGKIWLWKKKITRISYQKAHHVPASCVLCKFLRFIEKKKYIWLPSTVMQYFRDGRSTSRNGRLWSITPSNMIWSPKETLPLSVEWRSLRWNISMELPNSFSGKRSSTKSPHAIH
jgi:hypothetical protein